MSMYAFIKLILTAAELSEDALKMWCLHPRVLIGAVQLRSKVICDYEEDILELAMLRRCCNPPVLPHHPCPCCLAHPHSSSDAQSQHSLQTSHRATRAGVMRSESSKATRAAERTDHRR
eukprot:COSAG06_NODE_29554_length_554_cov_1.125275_1_plen_119_part_00